MLGIKSRSFGGIVKPSLQIPPFIFQTRKQTQSFARTTKPAKSTEDKLEAQERRSPHGTTRVTKFEQATRERLLKPSLKTTLFPGTQFLF